MNCPTCSTELLGVYAFCPQCGSAIPAAAEPAVKDASEELIAVPVVPESSPAWSTEYSHANFPEPMMAASEPVTNAYANQESSNLVEPVQAPVISEPVVSVYVAPLEAQSDAGSIAVANAAVSMSAAVPPVKTEPVIPKESKPLKTVGTFFFLLLSCIPVIGVIALLVFAFGGKNKSRKSLSRAILLYYLIAALLICVGFTVLFFFSRDVLDNLLDPTKWTDTFLYILETFFNF